MEINLLNKENLRIIILLYSELENPWGTNRMLNSNWYVVVNLHSVAGSIFIINILPYSFDHNCSQL